VISWSQYQGFVTWDITAISLWHLSLWYCSGIDVNSISLRYRYDIASYIIVISQRHCNNIGTIMLTRYHCDIATILSVDIVMISQWYHCDIVTILVNLISLRYHNDINWQYRSDIAVISKWYLSKKNIETISLWYMCYINLISLEILKFQ
jgi:hypothetical protein